MPQLEHLNEFGAMEADRPLLVAELGVVLHHVAVRGRLALHLQLVHGTN